MHELSSMLSSAVSPPSPARAEFQRPPRRAPVQEKSRSLFDLLLDETYPWESLHEEHKNLAIQILARLIVQAALGSEQQKGKES
jgi:hypothetical protein